MGVASTGTEIYSKTSQCPAFVGPWWRIFSATLSLSKWYFTPSAVSPSVLAKAIRVVVGFMRCRAIIFSWVVSWVAPPLNFLPLPPPTPPPSHAPAAGSENRTGRHRFQTQVHQRQQWQPQNAVSHTALCPRKTAYGIFFALSNSTRPANRRQSLQPRREIRPVTTKTASGIPSWPSRDPIEEEGGLNLYGFVENDGVDWLDFIGLEPSTAVSANGCISKCVGKIEGMFTNRTQLKVDVGPYKVSGYQYLGFMNVFNECGEIMEAFKVKSGGHLQPGREDFAGNDTSIPSGEYHMATAKNGLTGFLVSNPIPLGRGDIEVHLDAVTTECIAVELSSCSLSR